MNTIEVVNIKYDGCAERIRSGLARQGISQVEVDPENQAVAFEGDPALAKQLLDKRGYPEAGSAAA